MYICAKHTVETYVFSSGYPERVDIYVGPMRKYKLGTYHDE
jgi:hypothetical protein